MNAATKIASTSAAVALVLVGMWLFWPTSLGGGTTYVVTHGQSMEPGFSTGDLAVLRPAGSYEVGDWWPTAPSRWTPSSCTASSPSTAIGS